MQHLHSRQNVLRYFLEKDMCCALGNPFDVNLFICIIEWRLNSKAELLRMYLIVPNNETEQRMCFIF